MQATPPLQNILRYLIGAILLIGVAASTSTAADTPPNVPIPERGFISTQPAENWEHALISGNGKMGALVMSRPLNETIILNHERLFMPWFGFPGVIRMGERLDRVRSMIEEGEYRQAAEFVMRFAPEPEGDEMFWPDPLTPAFNLGVNMQSDGVAENYARTVDFQTGVASVYWNDERGAFKRQLFVSRPDNMVVMSIRGPKGAVDCELQLAHTAPEEDRFKEGFRKVEIDAGAPWMTYRGEYKKIWPNCIQGYEGLARVVPIGGQMTTNGETISISGADEVLVMIRINVLMDFILSDVEEMKQTLKAIEADWQTLLDRHAKAHGEIFNRVKLDLGGRAEDHALPTEDLIEKSSLGNLNTALLEKQFDAGRYAILSCSGNNPPTLQGVWTGTWNPPWMSDYTINGNVQSAIASTLSGNMAECMRSYLDYTERHAHQFEENAQSLFNARGILTPARMSAHGYTIHYNAEFCHEFWTAGAPWASHFFYDYYLYTGDEDYLRNHALPFMKKTALFFEDFLIEGNDGKYVFNPSYSPENTPANSNSQACINATMDVAAVKDLLQNLIAVCNELGIEQDGVRRWKNMLSKIPDYMINEDGAVKEWTTPKLEDNYAHRHASHLYPLFWDMPEEIANNPDLQEAFDKAVELRMKVRRESDGGVMSFGLVQLGQTATSLGKAETSYEIVDMLANKYWFPNMVSTHNPKSLFNVDICGGMPEVIIKMLVQSKPGHVTLLPALPKQWSRGQIDGVRCRGQIEVESLKWNANEATVMLRSEKVQEIGISMPGEINNVKVTQGDASVNQEDGWRIQLPKNESVTLQIERDA